MMQCVMVDLNPTRESIHEYWVPWVRTINYDPLGFAKVMYDDRQIVLIVEWQAQDM